MDVSTVLPHLRQDLRISQQASPNGLVFVLKDPQTERFFRFPEAEYSLHSSSMAPRHSTLSGDGLKRISRRQFLRKPRRPSPSISRSCTSSSLLSCILSHRF